MSTASPSSPSAPTTPATLTIASRLQDANERKTEGNDHFRQSKWKEALASYQCALDLLPKRANSEKSPAPPTGDDTGDDTEPNHVDPSRPTDHDEIDSKPDVKDELEANNIAEPGGEDVAATDNEKREVVRLRSMLHANIGACQIKFGKHKEAVEACTQALKDDPTYIKALQRRAASNEILDTWSSLSAAEEDYNTLLTLLQPASQKLDVESKLRNLKPRLDIAQKRETSEMLDKLKGLGNTLLGNFGLSTDNFKFEPNGQGGYSMNFVR
ncbi:hypothetical protein FA13DRAFT_1751637 [Coprinellus micaceus]|uniref:TPR-like protein n=1 Tax=Coprinellus micaceus TaxID=71717 RepID=A0A4Y7TYD2_COPMI|nr:hypothetical protein FA13DRAFT_1751637 [Coprinellus micaceus]